MATYFSYTFLDVAFATFLLDEVIIICSYSVFFGGMPNVDVFEYSASSMTAYGIEDGNVESLHQFVQLACTII